MVLFHGSREIVRFPEVRRAVFNKDFYFGFYCTVYKEQAERWATRYGKKGYVNSYDYIPNPALKYLKFEKMTDEWLDFIAACRTGKSHTYDIVEDLWLKIQSSIMYRLCGWENNKGCILGACKV